MKNNQIQNSHRLSASFRERSGLILLIVVFLLGLVSTGPTASASQGTNSQTAQSGGRTIYLPFIRLGNQSDLPLMTGVMAGWPSEDTLNNIMRPLDNWLTGRSGGRSTSIFGTFLTLDLQPHQFKTNVEDPLTRVWEAGYTPFVNLPAMNTDTAKEVATSAVYGARITDWAKSFKVYADGGRRFAYIAPLQEMNGEWVHYGGDPANFIKAFKRFQNIFDQVGVPRQSVKWVFAPNGWSRPGMPLFEAYYPGDEYVDVTAISAYNFGYCNGGVWHEPEAAFNYPDVADGRYLERLTALAPTKPIFIAQTATSSYFDKPPSSNPSPPPNPSEKERWLREAYKYLSDQPQVRAVIYFNENKECDWSIYYNGAGNPGYKYGVNNNGYEYISPADLKSTDHRFK